jgi:hydroxymethylbilane synthase
MKDVPTQLAKGIVQAAVLERASHKDLFVYKDQLSVISDQLGIVDNKWTEPANSLLITDHSSLTIATSSIRRKAQWLNRFPNHTLENLRGNVNTRLRKVAESNWHGAIFAAAGLERIGLRPKNSIELDWMLPAPAQGAIMVVCREADNNCLDACENFNDSNTALCTKIERDFLRTLLGGCSTPISALAVVQNNDVIFKGSLLSVDGKDKLEIERKDNAFKGFDLGIRAAQYILQNGGQKIVDGINNAK